MPPECQGVTTDQSWNQVLLQGAAVSKNPEDEDDDSGGDQMIIMPGATKVWRTWIRETDVWQG